MLLSNENAISTGGYQIANSLRFQAASSNYMARTPASSSGYNTWTFSFWAKLGAVVTTTNEYFVLNAYQDASNRTAIEFAGNRIQLFHLNGGSTSIQVKTNAVFRDPSAWYHFVIAYDDTQATAANRVIIYVNGVQQTSLAAATYPAQNAGLQKINTANVHNIGRQISSGAEFYDGQLAEVIMVSGQALTPSSFGATNALTGQWCAAKYTGTYGTNGFYLPFSNGTSTTTLGADSSGNGNNWTLTNFTRSAGVSDCWMYDVPSGNGSSVSGTQPSSNYCVFNPTIANTTNLINANLTRNGAVRTNVGSVILTNGKYYFETTIQDSNGNGGVGVKQATAYPLEGYNTAAGATYFANGEYKIEGGAQTAGFSSYTNGDVIGIAVDTTVSPAKIWFAKNNTWQGTGNPTTAGYSLTAGLDYYFAVIHGSGSSSTTASANFGQRSFAYTPPSGFKALCTANLPDSTIVKGNKYMDATTYTGNGTGQSIVNAGGFKPDLVWMKNRTNAANNALYNDITNSFLYSNLTNAEDGNTSVTINSNGWTTTSTSSVQNATGSNYVGWQWQAGQGSTSSNTNGSITSTTSVNATAGFSVVTYTGTGANATIGHGLGVAPSFYIVKRRNGAGTDYWCCYHVSIGATKGIYLNTTDAAGVSNLWNNTAPTSSVFNVATTTGVNASGGTYVAYCFAEIAGYSKFGSYTGNGSTDGPFNYVGFRPKLIMIKRTDTTGNWTMYDSTRNPYNAGTYPLYPNLSNAEDPSTDHFDWLSNGFKMKSTNQNTSGGTFIYACFATNPFAQSNAV